MPLPSLLNAPLPPTALVMPKLVPAATLKLPPLAPSVVARAVSNVAVVASVPPLSDSAPARAPMLLSCETCSVPPLTAVPPV